ncbi:heme/hemin ABC transporter substrate-binding protein [Nocardioides litoris]|uniref:heme/hemin ABC transporter substrate-binding protein n=1 Tax=Nocardioides litoris TaxID=1926648 RepID=UPI0011227AC0|nr:ABC transporter substrate-binding protein [Nocardioides litoris]
MPHPVVPHRRTTAAARAALAVAALVLTALVAACSPAVDAAGGETGDGRSATAVPALADVAPLADPRGWDGPVSVRLPDPALDPVDDPRPSLPARVTDAQGDEVVVTDVSRILALDIYGTLAHTVFELGLGDRVVGRDVSAQFPEAADLPLVTQGGHELSAEAILALDPTVVLTDSSLGPYDVLLQLEDAGIPVVFTDSRRGIDNIASLTQEVADALGVPAAGRELGARLEQEARATVDEVADVAPQDLAGRLRTVFLYVRGQAGVYYMFGEGSGADELITAAGGYDVAEEIGWDGMQPVTDEALVEAAPDVLLMMDEGLESVGGVDGLLERFPALANTPAGEHRRVVSMDDDVVLSFGPRTADVVGALAVALYAPDALSAG